MTANCLKENTLFLKQYNNLRKVDKINEIALTKG